MSYLGFSGEGRGIEESIRFWRSSIWSSLSSRWFQMLKLTAPFSFSLIVSRLTTVSSGTRSIWDTILMSGWDSFGSKLLDLMKSQGALRFSGLFWTKRDLKCVVFWKDLWRILIRYSKWMNPFSKFYIRRGAHNLMRKAFIHVLAIYLLGEKEQGKKTSWGGDKREGEKSVAEWTKGKEKEGRDGI